MPEVDLHHHGDRDIAAGLIDLAVNVRVPTPPQWLADVIADSITDLARYPRTEAAAIALAQAHQLDLDQVLPTAGGAEAFTLLARAIRPQHAVVIHPQFTEPEAALLAAGHQVDRLILTAESGFVLDPRLVPADADLVIVGNPTNPTSVLHPRSALAKLLRTGRLVVVDEAFMDAVPGESESMIPLLAAGRDTQPATAGSGLLVLRSLTKTWGLAGLRAGYAVGDTPIIAGLRAQQPPWSVSTPALAATIACLTEQARQLAESAAQDIDAQRDFLIRGLRSVGLTPVSPPRAPFVLVDTSSVRVDRDPGWLRLALRDQGFAVRRGETFPGLDPDWIRLAVRDEATTTALIQAIRTVLSGRNNSNLPPVEREPPIRTAQDI